MSEGSHRKSSSGEHKRHHKKTKKWEPVKVEAEADIDTDLATRKNVVKKDNIAAFYGRSLLRIQARLKEPVS